MRILLLNTYRVVNAKGGTEKVFCDMANAMAEKGHEVFAVCLDENQGLPGFQLDERVIFLNAPSALFTTTIHKVKIPPINSQRKNRSKGLPF